MDIHIDIFSSTNNSARISMVSRTMPHAYPLVSTDILDGSENSIRINAYTDIPKDIRTDEARSVRSGQLQCHLDPPKINFYDHDAATRSPQRM